MFPISWVYIHFNSHLSEKFFLEAIFTHAKFFCMRMYYLPLCRYEALWNSQEVPNFWTLSKHFKTLTWQIWKLNIQKNDGIHRIGKGLGIYRLMFPCVYCLTCLTCADWQKWKFPKIAHSSSSCSRSLGIFSFHLCCYQILWLNMSPGIATSDIGKLLSSFHSYWIMIQFNWAEQFNWVRPVMVRQYTFLMFLFYFLFPSPTQMLIVTVCLWMVWLVFLYRGSSWECFLGQVKFFAESCRCWPGLRRWLSPLEEGVILCHGKTCFGKCRRSRKLLLTSAPNLLGDLRKYFFLLLFGMKACNKSF